MLSNKDQAIKENIEKEHTIDTFYKNVLVNVEDIEDYHCETCYESDLDDICHIWQGNKADNGYGYWSVYSKELGKRITIKAHRFAYAYHYGFNELPVGVEGGQRYVINHLCHNRLCVNPIHLEVITNKENVSREKRKPKNA